MKYILENKLVIVAVALCICMVASISIISAHKQTIKTKNSQINQLEDKVTQLENAISQSEAEKEDLEDQISGIQNSNDNRAVNFQSNYSRRMPSSYNGNQIGESESYEAQGQATVVFRKRGCDYMILENSSGYIVAEWMGGNDPDQGDNIGGKFNSYGTKEFYNLSRNSETKLWIDDYMLSKSNALEKIGDKCD